MTIDFKIPMKRLSVIFSVLGCFILHAQKNEVLSVEKIMSDSVYLGKVPEDIQWDENSAQLFFTWRPMGEKQNATYKISTSDLKLGPISEELKLMLQKRQVSYSKDLKKALFERNGDIFIKNIKTGTEILLMGTVAEESNPVFNHDETSVIFQKGQNLYTISVTGQGLRQLTNFTFHPNKKDSINSQDQWLEEDQMVIFDIFKKNGEDSKNSKKPSPYYLPNSGSISSINADPTLRYVVFNVADQPKHSRNIIVPNYVTRSGYTEDIYGRTKVGSYMPTYTTKIYDLERDTIYGISTHDIPAIKSIPEYLKEYPDQLAQRKRENKDREVHIGQPIWTPNRSTAIVNVVSMDNKDRWIMQLDPTNGNLSLLDHQHDEAWIGGPGVGRRYRTPEMGWINDNTIYFQSEETGYSHLYTLKISNGERKQLTSGKYEVQTLQLSNDKKSFYFTANVEHPGITHFYKMPVGGGNRVQLTSLRGGNEATLSPDEKWLAIKHSTTTQPWELYLQENKPGATAKQITKTTSEAFNAYEWKTPEMITFKNRYGVDTYAQVLVPKTPLPNKPAVVFVHSNGYLQNVHYWWSYHFREYMFNNLLVDKGFTVINVDYTASSGYGRDVRTGIYRHMGGKDLSDVTDGAQLLIEKYGVNPNYIGLYGGSYGGFLTLMALFTEPDVFKSGAALRSVTDWAHYNQGYTSNILNEPLTDEKAYKRSSPIYFADGLKGNLLMTHGIVDVNVNFQDIVRLTQRLIELGKEDWELAVYPLEDHNFVEPASWTDQYKRILKLFEDTLIE